MEAALALFHEQGADAVEILSREDQIIGVLTHDDVTAAMQGCTLGQRVGEYISDCATSKIEAPAATDAPDYGFDGEPLRAILDALHDGVYITDAQGITVSVNKAYERITGIRREDIVGRHMSELVEEGYISKSVSLEVIQKRRPITLVQSVKDGRKIVVSGTPMFDDQGFLHHVVTNVRDVTELLLVKHAQEQLEQINRIREFHSIEKEPDSQEHQVVTSVHTKESYELAKRIATTQAKVLIQGETGTGKTMLARYIHRCSDRAKGPFVELNCAALPEGLIEAELFGYSPGAFTGASQRGKQGLLDTAHGGTLFLDEIGDLPLPMQVKLLKVIEENRFFPVGSTELRYTDIRLIAATHQDLQQRVLEGQFREDLYYRISVVPLTLPPLCQRRGEIIPLLHQYLEVFNQRYGRTRYWHPETLEFLLAHSWPGNIRELINLTERLVVTTTEDEITPQWLPANCLPTTTIEANLASGTLREQVTALERQLIESALLTHGTTRAAAAALGIDQSTLVKKTHRWRQSTTTNSNSEITP